MLGRMISSMFAKRPAGEAQAAPIPPRAAIEAYIASHDIRKLNIGAGPGGLDGWLATDVEPLADHIVYLDAAEPFPIADATFDYIYTEHMIEHVPWHAGARMLAECLRILKPGGTLRVATPDLAVLIGLYSTPRSEIAEHYLRWVTDLAMPGVDSYSPVFAINIAFRNWGHQFLYDGELLELALTRAGFGNVRRCIYGESGLAHLRGVECHGRNLRDESIAIFESMIFEADRPRA